MYREPTSRVSKQLEFRRDIQQSLQASNPFNISPQHTVTSAVLRSFASHLFFSYVSFRLPKDDPCSQSTSRRRSDDVRPPLPSRVFWDRELEASPKDYPCRCFPRVRIYPGKRGVKRAQGGGGDGGNTAARARCVT